MSFDVTYALTILPALLRASLLTLAATFGGMALALVFGLACAILRMSRLRIVSWTATGVTQVVRTTPLLVQLYLLFYVLPTYGIAMSAFATGVLGLGLHYGSYISEVYRAGIEAVPRSQWEASVALGFSRSRTWTSVILPQAFRRIIPPIGNYLVSMFKATPYLATITVLELLGTALNLADNSFRYFEPITLVGLIFLALSYPSAQFVRRLEKRFMNE